MEMRLIGQSDVAPTVALMQRIGVHFAGSRSPRVLRAVARDGVEHPKEAIIALAVENGQYSGLVVAFTERARYWRRFARRHPVEALEIGVHRISRRIKRNPSGGTASDTEALARVAEARHVLAGRLAPLGRERWTDDASGIAKVMYVAVDPGHRKGGIGTQLYRWFFCALRDAGIPRCDAEVSEGNVGAANLHRRFPFHIHEVPHGYFLWLMTSEVSRT